MPSITVSQDLFDRIWSLKEPGEKTEDQILKRVLGSPPSDDESLIRAYEKADQDIQSTNCQLAKPFLARLTEMTADFAGRNIEVVAISADRHDRAEADVKEFGWPFEVGYGLTLDTMHAMGLYVSEPRYALETDGPYAEPAMFALSPRGTAEVINISNAPFSLPDLAGLLSGITFIQNRDYAPGGTLE